MSSAPNLRSRVIRLAHANPDLRPHLLPILTAAWHETNVWQADATQEDLDWAKEKGLTLDEEEGWGVTVPIKQLLPKGAGVVHHMKPREAKRFVVAEVPMAQINLAQYSVPLVGLRKKVLKLDPDLPELVWDPFHDRLSVAAGHTRLCAQVVRGDTTARVKLYEYSQRDKTYLIPTAETVPSYVHILGKPGKV